MKYSPRVLSGKLDFVFSEDGDPYYAERGYPFALFAAQAHTVPDNGAAEWEQLQCEVAETQRRNREGREARARNRAAEVA